MGSNSEFRADWLAESHSADRQTGIFVFRTTVSLAAKPDKFEVQVSADQRYKLMVGDKVVGFGPQRGDVQHWFYDTIDLSPYLQAGENHLWALVWNFGHEAPFAQMTLQFGFLLQVPEGVGLQWEVAKLDNWTFENCLDDIPDVFTSIGPGETFDGGSIASWTDYATDSSLPWKKPAVVKAAAKFGAMYEPYWALLPRSIPLMEYREREKPMTRRYGFLGDTAEPDQDSNLAQSSPLIFDAGELLCAYPRFRLKGTPGAVVTIAYAEALMYPQGSDNGSLDKGHRDEVEGKELRGIKDFVLLGESSVEFEPLWWRTWRYMKISISGGKAELERLEIFETGYPYDVQASFKLSNPTTETAWVQPLWDVGIRTAQRCAGETYFDCPYYEQLQYVGDTRIQALLHYYLSTDRALARASIETFRWSIVPEGLTYSRYPSRIAQFIPPFSLWWVLMLYDQMLYDRAAQPIELAKTIIRGWNKLNPERPFWCFADWVGEWRNGVPPGGKQSLVHELTLTLAQIAIDLMEGRSQAEVAEHLAPYQNRNGLTVSAVSIDQPPTEHSEALFRIAQTMVGSSVEVWPTKELETASAAQTTLYFSYYKHSAQPPADFIHSLEPWKQMLNIGLSTFAEVADPTRSDCHAWSAHPLLNLFQIVAGVTSASPGWRSANIAPVPGGFGDFAALIPHPDGELRVVVEGDHLTGQTPVPANVVWQGASHRVPPGTFAF